MKRTRTNKPDVILTSDWHLRETTPLCRTDHFWKAQWDKVCEVAEIQRKYNCPVLHAGDLFHHWKPSPHLLSVAMELLPDDFYTVYGQHDLPQHNLELSHKSGIHTLEMAGKVKVLAKMHWGQEFVPYTEYFEIKGHNILTWHHMAYQVKPFPGASGGMARGLLKKHPEYDLIVTGDNHKTFVEEYERRLLVNPGSLTRQTSDQVDHEPCVFLYYVEGGGSTLNQRVEKVILKHEKGVISREHIEREERRDERIEAFISRLDKDWEAEMSFEDNLERFVQVNNVKPEVITIIQKAIEQ